MRTLGSVFLIVIGLLSILPGCATAPSDPAALAVYRANNDPLEPLNRKVFACNQVIDRFLIKPIAKAYIFILPQFGRDGLRNLLKNLNEPVVFANDTLQGGFKRAGKTACRFAINTTVGLAGLVDVAGRHGLERQSGDFGQTLHTWGFQEGPYLVLPVMGPSNPRDAIGSGVDIYIYPWRYVWENNNYPTGLSIAEAGLSGIDERSRNIDSLDELQRESVDYYAAFRSLFRQHRAAELAQPAAPAADLYNDPDSAPQKSP
jgi:phospholipid-binding lipoprotein MlaA